MDSQRLTTPVSLKRNIAWNSAGSLVYQGCLWLTTIIVVVASPNYENSGYLAYAMAIGNLFLPIALYGMRTIQVSDLENKYSQQNYFAFRIFTIGLSFVIFTLYTMITTSSSFESILVVIAFLLFKADECFANVCQGAEQKADRMDYIGKSLLARGILCAVSFSLIVWFLDNLILAVLGMFVSGVSVTIVYDLPHARLFGSVVPRITKEKAKALLRKCAPAVLSNILCAGVVSVSRQVFGLSFGEDALGIYAAVATPAVIVQMLASLLYAPLLTTIARKWRDDDPKAFGSYLLKTFGKMFLVLLVAMLLMWMVGAPALTLIYGDSISDYVGLFPGVLVISACIAIIWFLTDVLIVLRRMRDVLVFNAISFTILLVTIKPFIDALYMDGINCSIIVSYAAGIVVGAILLVRFIMKKAPIPSSCP